MTFGRSVTTTIMTLKEHDMNRERFNMPRKLVFHGTMYLERRNMFEVDKHSLRCYVVFRECRKN